MHVHVVRDHVCFTINRWSIFGYFWFGLLRALILVVDAINYSEKPPPSTTFFVASLQTYANVITDFRTTMYLHMFPAAFYLEALIVPDWLFFWNVVSVTSVFKIYLLLRDICHIVLWSLTLIGQQHYFNFLCLVQKTAKMFGCDRSICRAVVFKR